MPSIRSSEATGTRILRPTRTCGISPRATALYAASRPMPSTCAASGTVRVARSTPLLTLVMGGGKHEPAALCKFRYHASCYPARMQTQKAAVPSLGQVVGRNVQDLRNEAGMTQVEFTARCQQLGLSWHRPKVSVLESGGARNVTLSNLVLLALALEAQPIDLLAGDGEVALNPELRCPLSDLRLYLQGGNAPPLMASQVRTAGSPVPTLEADPPLEVELAKRFDVPVSEIRYSASNAFEGRTVTDERDAQMARLGPLTKEQRTTHRGHVMRRISAAVEADLRRRNADLRRRNKVY